MANPPRLRRADSFFGVHFDFHCRPGDRELGRRVTPAMVRDLLRRIRPDYIQVDCKGHPGLTSYPSAFGTTADGFVRDPLPIWRRETARAGVALFMHYSGVWDSAAVARHPRWARVDEHGKRDKKATSVFGPYVDQLMIPQLLELALKYGVDGAWVDGDCWATGRDWSPAALAAWRRATGQRTAPRSPDDPRWPAFSDFCRDAFRLYLQHYVDTLHHKAPGFQVASNWAYSSHMPEPVTIAVDFLSGDFWPHDSLNSARFEGRILAAQDRPWDLMAWGFACRSGEGFTHRVPKTAVQLQAEAAVVLALGGGFQAYFTQKRDASVSAHDIAVMAAVAPFCRARQKWCHRSTAVPQIGLLYSASALYRGSPLLFSPWAGMSDAYRGVLEALVEGHHAVDAVLDAQLADRARDYPLLIVPEWAYLGANVKRDLCAYVRRGGSLLLIGQTTRLFQRELGVRLGRDSNDDRRYWDFDGPAPGDGGPPPLAGLWGRFPAVRLGRDARPLGRLYFEHDRGGTFTPAATVRRLGRGRIAGLYAPLGVRYLAARSHAVRAGLTSLVRALFARPLVELLTPANVDLTVRRQGADLAINLVNTVGAHACDFTWDALPPTPPLELLVRLPAPPRSVRLQPANRALRCTRTADGYRIAVPPIAIHEVVVIR